MNSPMLAPVRSYARPGDLPDVIVLIEYSRTKHGWKPCAVISHDANGSPDYYDFDWCEHDEELCCHLSGCGGSGEHDLGEMVDAAQGIQIKFWHDAARLKLTAGGKAVSKSEALKRGYQIIDAPLNGNPFEGASEDTPVEYCLQCNDHYNTERVCRHLYYQEGAGWDYLGCGASEADFTESQRSLYLLLDVLPPDAVTAMKQALLSGKFNCEPREEFDYASTDITLGKAFRLGRQLTLEMAQLGKEHNAEDRYWPGIAWLMSITPKTREAWALTLGWFYQWEREGWNNQCVLSNITFIRHLPSDELDAWLALDPHDPGVLNERPLKVRIPFKSNCANDAQFLAHPDRTREVLLWPKNPGKDSRALRLTVAEVKRTAKNEISIWFGRALEHNGRHVSALKGYRLIS